MSFADYTRADFAVSPLMFYYEVTTACDLVCKHCRASAQELAHPGQLTTDQSLALIEQIASFPRKPNLVLTGGDPLKRRDIFVLIRHAVASGLPVALTPSATPLATREALQDARDAGVRILGISLDGPDARTHDAFRGWEGSFDRTMQMMLHARQLGLGVQINTTITRRNVHLIEQMAQLLSTRGIVMWSVFFLIPVGRGIDEERISAEQYELVFEQLWIEANRQPYAIKTTEAPHYRRYVLQRHGNPLAEPGAGQPASLLAVPAAAAGGGSADLAEAPAIAASSLATTGPRSAVRPTRGAGRDRGDRAPLGVRDGNGIMFLSHLGEIYPAGFLPLLCGRFPQDSVVDVYQNHPTFLALRDPDQFSGDCGICEYRFVCGGSRSRAYALTGDPLAAEPDCNYEPRPAAAPESGDA